MPSKTYRKRTDGKNATGRPTAMSDDILRKLQLCFVVDCSIREACSKVGIPESTFWTWWRSSRKFKWKMTMFGDTDSRLITFKEFIETVRIYQLMAARKTIYDAVNKGNVKVAMRLLERLDPRYSKNVGKDAGKPPINVIFGGKRSQFIKNID